MSNKYNITNLSEDMGDEKLVLPNNIPLRLESLEYKYYTVSKCIDANHHVFKVVYECSKCGTRQMIKYDENGNQIFKLKNNVHPCVQTLCSESVDKYNGGNFKRIQNYSLVGRIANILSDSEEICVNILNDGTVVCIEQLNLISIAYTPRVFQTLTDTRDRKINHLQ